MRGDGGGAQIDRQAINVPVVKAGPQRHDRRRAGVVAHMHGGRDGPAAFAQDRLQLAQQVCVDLDPLQAHHGLQGLNQTFQIASGFVHVGLFDLDILQADRRGQDNIAGLGAFANDLAVDLAFGRHINDDVPLNRGLTSQAAALGQPAFVVIALFDGVPV